MKLAFVCVQNAGRSQLSAAFAEREAEERGLEDEIDVVSGGTAPADEIHPPVQEILEEREFDSTGRTPRQITDATLETCDVVVTMGCSTLDLDADSEADADAEAAADAEAYADTDIDTDARDWALADPHGKSPDRVRAMADEIEARVGDLFDELVGEQSLEPDSPAKA